MVAISFGVLAFNLLPLFLVSDLETELGILPEVDLILKTDQKRFGLTLKVLPKDEKNASLLFSIAFFTSVLNFVNFSFR